MTQDFNESGLGESDVAGPDLAALKAEPLDQGGIEADADAGNGDFAFPHFGDAGAADSGAEAVSLKAGSVLRRKLVPRATAPAFDMPMPAFDMPMEPAEPQGRVLARSFTRAASRVAGLVTQGKIRSSRAARVPELLDLIDVEGFVALLANGDSPPGLVILDPTAFVSVIEAMTIGTLGRGAPLTRRATPTDAALIAELADAVLADMEANPEDSDPFAPGFRFGQHARDQRLLDVMLDDVSYQLTVMEVELTAGDVTRQGEFMLALPEPEPAFAAFPSYEEPVFETEPMIDSGWDEALESAVMAAPAELRAVLGRVTLPLAQVMALGVDSRLTLPLVQLEEVQLESIDRRPMALARLGQYRGMRALRLTSLTGDGCRPDTTGAGFAEASPMGFGQSFDAGEDAAVDPAQWPQGMTLPEPGAD